MSCFKVLDKGFEFDGRRDKSLSAIALEVTGSEWNGFLFFGIADGAAKRKEVRNKYGALLKGML